MLAKLNTFVISVQKRVNFIFANTSNVYTFPVLCSCPPRITKLFLPLPDIMYDFINERPWFLSSPRCHSFSLFLVCLVYSSLVVCPVRRHFISILSVQLWSWLNCSPVNTIVVVIIECATVQITYYPNFRF